VLISGAWTLRAPPPSKFSPISLQRKIVSEKFFGIDLYPQVSAREGYFVQWLDHFNPDGFETFDQSVWINEEFYLPGGPVFLYITTKNDDYRFWTEYSHITNIAQQLNGVIYALEPRYFGQNQPTLDLSVDNLARFLSINQTMADVADLVTYLRQQFMIYGSDKFVLYGYDTGATLATWIHQANPGLIDGVWAVAAPTVVTYDFSMYYPQIFMLAEELLPVKCFDTISYAFIDLDNLISSNESIRIQELFNLPAPLDLSNEKNIQLFYDYFLSSLSVLIEFGSPPSLEYFCSDLEYGVDKTDLERVGSYLSEYFQYAVLDYNEFIQSLREESWQLQTLSDRQTYHMACRQWSWFRSTTYLPEPINSALPSNYFSDICFDVFNLSQDDILAGNMRTNNEYPIRVGVQNVYFTNGEYDPTYLISITNDLNPTATADLIPKKGKAFELAKILSGALLTEELLVVRENVETLITHWVS
jgi:pimeloyl-ACP methyl ester carboxylesterase